jgi:GST-like protein
LIEISQGDQFTSGFVEINPNSKIPAMVDRSGSVPVRIFESGAILVYLAEKFGAFLPPAGEARAECLSWLFWQVGSTPLLGGGLWPLLCLCAYQDQICDRPLRVGSETSNGRA